jgi:4-hydroxy-tetrahydrodipicolinate synthase
LKKYYGVIPPIITPVDEREDVDEAGFRALLRHCVARGLHGIFVAGTNGETMSLTREQRDKAIKIALDEVGGQVPVMAGVMDTGTRRVIENIKRLEQMGGTCAVVTPIFYARHTAQDETLRHFEAISRAAAIDILMYSIPPFTGQAFTFDTVKRISEMDHVVGYKDSSGAFPDFIKCLQHFRGKDFCVLQGSTPLAAASMLMGADGFIPSIAPVFPELFVAFYEAGKAGDLAKTMELNALIGETSSILGMSKNQISANKFAISRLGFTDRRVIAPLDPVTAEDAERIERKIKDVSEALKKYGFGK